MTSPTAQRPEFWKLAVLCGLPKEANSSTFDKYRWIGLCDVLMKLFLKTLMLYLAGFPDQGPVFTVGFEKGCSTTLVSELVRVILQLSSQWQGVNAIITIVDIYHAFDTYGHDLLAQVLYEDPTVDDVGAAVLLDEISLISVVGRLGDDETPPTLMEVGGIQGRSETPKLYNKIINHVLHPLVSHWKEQNMGFKLPCEAPGQDIYATHTVWADNMFFFSADWPQWKVMMDHLLQRLQQCGLRLKPSQSAVLPSLFSEHPADAGLDVIDNHVVHVSGEGQAFRIVVEAECLGVKIDQQGSSMTSWNHRRHQAEAVYHRNRSTMRNPRLMPSERVKAFGIGPTSSITFGACGWTVDKKFLKEARAWDRRKQRGTC